jgi:tRNA uridine 5-carboxymethylaminomethyl modification enzyme
MDLVEPYRMFTSRAEFRLALRIDNAADRLMPHAERYGLLADDARRIRDHDVEAAASIRQALGRRVPDEARIAVEAVVGAATIAGATFEHLLRMPQVRLSGLAPWLPEVADSRAEVLERVEVETKYAGYVRRQEREVAAMARLDDQAIPLGLDFAKVVGLSTEAGQKVALRRPRTFGQASRIDGVRAADLSILMVHLERRPRSVASTVGER